MNFQFTPPYLLHDFSEVGSFCLQLSVQLGVALSVPLVPLVTDGAVRVTLHRGLHVNKIAIIRKGETVRRRSGVGHLDQPNYNAEEATFNDLNDRSNDFNTIQYNTIHYNAIRYDSILFYAVQCDAMPSFVWHLEMRIDSLCILSTLLTSLESLFSD